jgi:hypothetical protein
VLDATTGSGSEMTVVDALAIIGGVTGPTAAAAQVYAVRRDRPQLTVNFGCDRREHQPPVVWLTVLNHGRQPTTIREAGFYGSNMPMEIESQDRGKLKGTAVYNFKLVREPIFLDPGVLHQASSRVPDAPEFGYHVDFPLRAYVIDAMGNRTWGEAAPIVRIAVGHGPCPPNFPPHLWNEPTEPLRPARVEASWKLWLKRELRQGDPGRPSADDLKKLTNSN